LGYASTRCEGSSGRELGAGKLKRLRATGWKVGSATEFLQLSNREAMLVELKLS